MSIYAN